MLNKLIATIATSALALLVLATTPALAQVDIGLGAGGLTDKIGSGVGFDTNVGPTGLSQTVGRIIKIALSLVGTVFLALIVYAGILWMTASGSPEQVEKARNIIQSSTIGLIIVMAAYGITVFVLVTAAISAGGSGQAVGGGAGNFWKSFGESFKANWSSFVF